MRWDDEQVDLTIAGLLRTGVIIAAALVAAGGVWYLAGSGRLAPSYGSFRGEPADLRTVPGVLKGVGAGNPAAVIALGLMILLATPIARVAFSVVAFAMQRDRTYVAVTLIVLAVLLASVSGLTPCR
jgi:uncharacterized membrane protein